MTQIALELNLREVRNSRVTKFEERKSSYANDVTCQNINFLKKSSFELLTLLWKTSSNLKNKKTSIQATNTMF